MRQIESKGYLDGMRIKTLVGTVRSGLKNNLKPILKWILQKKGTEQSWARFSFQGQKWNQTLNESKEVTKANALINPKTGPIS